MNPTLIAIIIILLLVIFLQHSCNNRELEAVNSTLSAERQNYQALQVRVNRKGDSIQYLKSLVYHQQGAINAKSDSLFDLKVKLRNTLALYQGISSTRIDTFFVRYKDTTELPKTIDSSARANLIMVPALFEVDSPYYSIGGKVLKSGVAFDHIEARDSFAIRFIEGKFKLFKPRDVEAQVKNNSPYVKQLAGKAAIYRAKNNWFISAAIAVAAFVSGFIIHSL